jgi:DNA-binding XRE family transcriptional regulator
MARKAAGYTQEQLAEALHVERSTVVRWEAGRNVPQPYLWPKLGRLLSLTRDQLREVFKPSGLPAATAPNEQPVYGAELATYRAKVDGWQADRTSQQPVHVALLTQFETLTDTYRHIDYQAGARTVYGDTVAHLNRLLDATHRVPSGLYQRFILDLGDVAQLAAWLAIDGQDYATARQYCGLALSAAQEGEDPSLHAYTLGVMSYIHLHAGRGSEALRLLQAALRIAENPQFGVNPAVRSWL